MEYIHDPVKFAAELKEQLESGTETYMGAAQHNYDLQAWDEFFKKHKPATIIELGTGSGAFSDFLSLQSYFFYTFDNHEPNNPVDGFKLLDIFSTSGEAYLKHLIERSPTRVLLYCDNGDKPREVRMFSKYLNEGDFLATHDYCIEIQPEDIPYNFELIINKGLTAIFKKIR